MNRLRLMAVSLALSACASEHGYRLPLTRESQAELADLLPKDADVTWREGDAVSREAVRGISLAGGVATWVPADKSEARKVPEAALRSMDGFLWGGLVGTLTGLAVGSQQHVEFIPEPAR